VLLRNIARGCISPNRANQEVVKHCALPQAQGAKQVVVNLTKTLVGIAELRLTSGRELDDVPSTVRGIAAARNQLSFLELVEKSDDVAWIQAQRVRECLLAGRAVLAEKLQGDQMTWTEAARLERALECASTDAGEVLEQREESLIRRRLCFGFGHAPNNI
jgi:hypothetical protein